MACRGTNMSQSQGICRPQEAVICTAKNLPFKHASLRCTSPDGFQLWQTDQIDPKWRNISNEDIHIMPPRLIIHIWHEWMVVSHISIAREFLSLWPIKLILHSKLCFRSISVGEIQHPWPQFCVLLGVRSKCMKDALHPHLHRSDYWYQNSGRSIRGAQFSGTNSQARSCTWCPVPITWRIQRTLLSLNTDKRPYQCGNSGIHRTCPAYLTIGFSYLIEVEIGHWCVLVAQCY